MNQTGFVDFGFGEKVIRVPWKEFVWFVEPGLCALGLMEGGEGTHILGDTFLRAAFGMLLPLSYPSRINLHLTYLPIFSFPPFCFFCCLGKEEQEFWSFGVLGVLGCY